MLRLIAAVSMTFALLPGQGPKQIEPRQFLFDNYTSVMRFDVKRFCELEMWESLLSSPMRVAVAEFEKELGFSVDDLDSVTTALQWDSEKSSMRQVLVMQGHAPLSRPEDRYDRWTRSEINGHPVLRDAWVRGGLSLDWGENVRVEGREEQIAPVLMGRPRIGLPSADVMSLTVGVKNLLGYVCFDLRADSFRKVFLRDVMPEATWPEGDGPQFFCARAAAIGDPDDPHVQVEMLVRHTSPGDGLAATQRQVEAGIQKLLAEPQLRLLRPLLKKIERDVDGSDAIWRVDLGRARNVIGTVATLGVPWLFLASSRGQAAQAIEILEEEVLEVEEPPVEKAKPAGAGGGGK